MPPTIPATPIISPVPAGARGSPGRPPPGGLIDITLPWVTFCGTADAPGTLGRLGPITGPEARRVVSLGLRNPSTQWRIVLTDPDRRAIAVARVARARIPRPEDRGARIPRAQVPAGRHDPPGVITPIEWTGTVGRVTIVMPADALDAAPASHPRLTGEIYARILTAARRARDGAREQAEADRRAPGGCAHTTASPAYSPPPRIREYVAARDQTCRGPGCGQPAWQGDLDHTIPYDQGGPTCPCDLGAVCRRHHQLKQRPGWILTQPQPGVFCWTTPAGRTYTTHPDPYYTG
jgi:hypothetical protein